MCGKSVALLAEGVDRNKDGLMLILVDAASPSSRRAWIEISVEKATISCYNVALLAEGVDRNLATPAYQNPPRKVALLAEGVDRNCYVPSFTASERKSPSSRRAWIEIKKRN